MHPMGGLDRLRDAGASPSLDNLEADVFSRLDKQKRGDVFGGRFIPIQLAVSCAAVLVGLAVAQMVGASASALHSETIVLSDDSGLVPSVRLEGGA